MSEITRSKTKATGGVTEESAESEDWSITLYKLTVQP